MNAWNARAREDESAFSGLVLGVLVLVTACGGPGTQGFTAEKHVEVSAGGDSIQLRLATRTEIVDGLRRPDFPPLEGAWLRSTVVFENESKDTVRIWHPDTGCLVQLHVFEESDSQDVLWESPMGCQQTLRSRILGPGEQFSYLGMLIMVRQFVGESLNPGVHSVQPTVRFSASFHRRPKNKRPLADTLVSLSRGSLHFPEESQ